MNIEYSGINELKRAYVSKDIKPSEVVEAYLKCIANEDSRIHAFLDIYSDEAIMLAKTQDELLIKEDGLPELFGIPIAIKDTLCVKGHRTTCGSRILENFKAPYDATCIKRLKNAGAILLGKTNMDEFAMGSSTENSAFQPTLNPFDENRVPGGSSGGSAACVAAHMCAAAIGSDTGGSIRQPASFCGIVGLKPTYGRVSRFGLVAFASSLDQVGPMTKTVEDTALLLEILAGFDDHDMTSSKKEVLKYRSFLDPDPKSFTIGLPNEYFVEGMSNEVRSSILTMVKKLEDLGVRVKEIALPHTEYSTAVYYIIATSEASSNLARYDGVKYGFRYEDAKDLLSHYKNTRAQGFGSEVKRRIMLGTFSLSSGYYDAYYKKASQVRRLITDDFRGAFKEVDLIVSPTTPTPAFLLEEKIDDPLTMYLNDIYTNALNLAGLPGISIPVALSNNGLPIGLQIMGQPFQEEKLLGLASLVEKTRDIHIAGVPKKT